MGSWLAAVKELAGNSLAPYATSPNDGLTAPSTPSVCLSTSAPKSSPDSPCKTRHLAITQPHRPTRDAQVKESAPWERLYKRPSSGASGTPPHSLLSAHTLSVTRRDQLFDPLNLNLNKLIPTLLLSTDNTFFLTTMLMYRIAHLACILSAAALCSGVDVEPRGDIRYDLPGSNLKEASISQPSGPGHNRGVTKDRRDYDRRDSGRNLKEASITQPFGPGHNRGVTKDRRDYDRRDYRLAGGAGGDSHRQEPPHSTLHRRVYSGTQSPHWGIQGGQAPHTVPHTN